jgi:hypothetical protein
MQIKTYLRQQQQKTTTTTRAAETQIMRGIARRLTKITATTTATLIPAMAPTLRIVFSCTVGVDVEGSIVGAELVGANVAQVLF